MELRITLRTEGERKAVPGFAGAMGATEPPNGAREASIELTDMDQVDSRLFEAAAGPLTQMVDGVFITEDVVNVDDTIVDEDENGNEI